MGTHADFYIRKLKSRKILWIGSIDSDGYPSGIRVNILRAKTPKKFKERLYRFIAENPSNGCKKDRGFPWPWKHIPLLTDYQYIYDEHYKEVIILRGAHNDLVQSGIMARSYELYEINSDEFNQYVVLG